MSTPKIYLDHTYSYLELRKAVGWIGILLPIVLMIGSFVFEGKLWPSISHYYYSVMGRVFIGALCAIALFMFYYTGYDRLDNWAGNLAGIFAIGVAWVPTTERLPIDTLGWIHYGFAAALLITFAFFSLFLFTKTKDDDDANRTREKKARDSIYRTCGWIILISIASIPVYGAIGNDLIPNYNFWAETVALVAFGISWLTKGGSIMPDKNE